MVGAWRDTPATWGMNVPWHVSDNNLIWKYYIFFIIMAAKKKVSVKKTTHKKEGSFIIQFAVVFIILAAMALVAFTYKNYL